MVWNQQIFVGLLILSFNVGSFKIGNSYWIEPDGGVVQQFTGLFERDLNHEISSLDGIENSVHFIVLKHKDSDFIKSWEIAIGKGSQIYSITWANSELIGEQVHNGIWIDRVLQTVAVSTNKTNHTHPYFIHQAGTYIHPAIGLKQPFWSPMLGSVLDEDKKAFRTLVWPQQAHVYANIPWTSTVLLQQNIRDVGDGIIEITYVYTNFGEDRIDFIDFPWGGFSKKPIPHYVKSLSDGDWVRETPSDWVTNLYPNTQANGWFAMLKTCTSNSEGFGVVYGKSAVRSDGVEQVRWGPTSNQENLTVLEALPGAILLPKKTYFMRYYLMFGQLDTDLHLQGNRLSNYVDWGELSFSLSETELINPCQFGGAFGFSRCNFFLLSRPVLNPLPVLLLRDRKSGKLVISTSPYALSSKPYQDRNTEYLAFLGWGIRSSEANPGLGFVKLGDLFRERSFYPDPGTGKDVWVYAKPKP